MSLAGALREWAEREMASEPKPGIRYLATLYGQGNMARGTTAIARELGVARRTIERFITQEKAAANYPAAAEGRNIERSTNPRVREWYKRQRESIVRERLVERIYRDGLTVHGLDGVVCYSHECRRRQVRKVFGLPRGDELRDFADAIDAGRYDDAAHLFEPLFFEGYELPGGYFGDDVDRIDMGASA